MNQKASSSNALDIYAPAFEWGDGHSKRFATAERLTKDRFASPTIVTIDSCFTQAVYGQHSIKDDERRIHHIQTIHANNIQLEEDANLVVAQTYEFIKKNLFNFYENPEESFNAAQSAASELITLFPPGVRNKAGTDALSW